MDFTLFLLAAICFVVAAGLWTLSVSIWKRITEQWNPDNDTMAFICFVVVVLMVALTMTGSGLTYYGFKTNEHRWLSINQDESSKDDYYKLHSEMSKLSKSIDAYLEQNDATPPTAEEIAKAKEEIKKFMGDLATTFESAKTLDTAVVSAVKRHEELTNEFNALAPEDEKRIHLTGALAAQDKYRLSVIDDCSKKRVEIHALFTELHKRMEIAGKDEDVIKYIEYVKRELSIPEGVALAPQK